MEVDDRPQGEDKAKMGLPHVTSFCCCLGLEVGAKIVAYLHTLISVCLVVVCSIYAQSFNEMVGTVDNVGDEIYTKWYRIAVVAAIISTGHVLIAIMLLYGVYKRSKMAVALWVGTMVLVFVIAVAVIVVSIALTGVSGSGSDIFVAFIEGVIFFGVLAYCILSVYSYYLMLKSCDDMEGPGGDY
ncbi:uncharacterized protein LOC113239624 [Hyposmocoma kahamanoa]|uniref:uncharacterized protein LOC113239624 n=1 Tax=Hyposmocoma kahamanoa TaxID=1477025 RepID=UPI000E6D5FF2|nr:uncharacterized protein LOC113239624 [Hyposmocoma kahamanoa]